MSHITMQSSHQSSQSCIAGGWGDYHDTVWGTPITDSTELFGQLMLCTQQCGISWNIVWNKRHHYRQAFHGWNMARVAAMTEAEMDALCDKEGPWAGKVIQNRAKLSAIIHNARQCLVIHRNTAGGLAAFLWRFVAAPESESPFAVRLAGLAEPMAVSPDAINAFTDCKCASYLHAFGATSAVSDRLSAEIKGKGPKREGGIAYEPFKFLGSTTIQAFLLQNGLLNGHGPQCAKNPRAGPLGAYGAQHGGTSSPPSSSDDRRPPATRALCDTMMVATTRALRKRARGAAGSEHEADVSTRTAAVSE